MHLIFQWLPDVIRPPRWMGFIYYSARRNRCLYVCFPLNFLIVPLWFINDRWAKIANAESWIEKEVRHRASLSLNSQPSTLNS